VLITAENADGHRIRISVSDTGIGIPTEKLAGLFEKFSQADSSTTRRYGGTGLGLPISKQLVELMGGVLRAESRLDEGSTFTFSLPLPLDPEPPVARQPNPDFSGLRALIVDHTQINRFILQEQFGAWGIRSGSFATALEALTAMRAARESGDPYDFVIAGFRMPEMDGVALAKEIRSDPAIRDTIIIILSSICDSREIKAIHRTSINACMVKPVRQSHLFNTLHSTWAERAPTALRVQTERATLTPSEAIECGPLRFKGSHLRVLVAEDNIVNQKVAVRILEKMGIRVDVAANGREAIDMLRLLPYDCVLMDCQMPEMDGYEAAAEIRRLESPGRRIAIIAMTAGVLGDGHQRCLESGMDDFIAKPIKIQNLVDALKRWTPAGQSQ
jgi:CheY-like chemotaxis protein